MIEKPCPICQKNAKHEFVGPGHRHIVECEFCGFYEITSTAESIFKSKEDRSLFPYLSAHIRQNSSFQTPFQLDSKNWEYFAKVHKATPVIRKMDYILRLSAQRTDFPGSQVSFLDNDPPLIDAANSKEMLYLLKQIEELGYIDLELTSTSLRCIILAKGWERLQEQTEHGIPGRCFVAMSFDDTLNKAYDEGIYPALKDDCGLDPIRMDKEEHNEKICDKIIAEIRQSQFLVADFTRHRPGVYFEAGFALGLGRPVIWTCRKDELENAHFDTRQYNHIVWEAPAELREKLRNRVMATIPKEA
jgi:hypothetical protein